MNILWVFSKDEKGLEQKLQGLEFNKAILSYAALKDEMVREVVASRIRRKQVEGCDTCIGKNDRGSERCKACSFSHNSYYVREDCWENKKCKQEETCGHDCTECKAMYDTVPLK